MRIETDGGLVVQTAGGAVRWNKPTVYQEVNRQRQAVEGKFVLHRRHRVSFEVAAYDATKPLVIDPTLVYSTYVGGSNDDGGRAGNGLAVDVAGNAYLTGFTLSADFPTTSGAFDTSSDGAIFVTKLNAAGSALVYSTYLSGNGDDTGRGVAVDSAGSAYITGGTTSTSFPTTSGAFQATAPGGGADGFVSKLDPAGSTLIYSTYLGGSGPDSGGFGIAVDAGGNAYITGYENSTDFPTTLGAYQTTLAGVDRRVCD